MRHLHKIRLLVAMATLMSFPLAALALEATSSKDGKQCCTKGEQNYDKATEFSFDGVVEDVKIVDGKGKMNGVHVMVHSDKYRYEVHLGPEPYLAALKVSFEKGDLVTVTAAPIEGVEPELQADAILMPVVARQIIRGEQVMDFRDEDGVPLWSRSHGKRR